MKAMILAAGKGKRLQPLTLTTPKPLIKVAGKTLIEHRIAALKQAGITEIIINTSYLAQQIVDYLGNGAHLGVSLSYRYEGETPLETGGGIINALDFFNDQPFIVSNSDIIFDYPLDTLHLPSTMLAHLVLIQNPPHHQNGDFALINNRLNITEKPRFTFSGVGCYHPDLFKPYLDKSTKIPLIHILQNAIAKQLISGEYSEKPWYDIGTPERLTHAQQMINQSSG